MKQAMVTINLQNDIKENKNLVHTGIIYAIDMHRKAMWYLLDVAHEA